jgi:hypothetical protein
MTSIFIKNALRSSLIEHREQQVNRSIHKLNVRSVLLSASQYNDKLIQLHEGRNTNPLKSK